MTERRGALGDIVTSIDEDIIEAVSVGLRIQRRRRSKRRVGLNIPDHEWGAQAPGASKRMGLADRIWAVMPRCVTIHGVNLWQCRAVALSACHPFFRDEATICQGAGVEALC